MFKTSNFSRLTASAATASTLAALATLALAPAAHAAGMMTVMVPDILDPNEEMHDKCIHVAESLHAVLDLLRPDLWDAALAGAAALAACVLYRESLPKEARRAANASKGPSASSPAMPQAETCPTL